jgi:hypothetical protein
LQGMQLSKDNGFRLFEQPADLEDDAVVFRLGRAASVSGLLRPARHKDCAKGNP